MLETRKVDNNKVCKALFVNLQCTSIRYVTGTRYSENTAEVQVCRSSVVNK